MINTRREGKRLKIVITDAGTVTNGDIDLTVFEKFGEVVTYDVTPDDLLCSRLRDADIVLCNKTVIGKREMDAAKKLRFIGLFATGYNNIDVEYAAKKGITVCNAGQYSQMAVAQHVFAFILEHASRVAEYGAFTAEGGWIKSRFFSAFSIPTSELCGKTLGIVGYGSIGSAVSRIALAFGMRVLVFNRSPREDKEVTFTDLDTLLSASDYITVHVPLNEESRGMFCKETFKKCKKGAYFINTARGGVVVEEDLRAALESGQLSGAAVDVLTLEPMREDCPLFGAPNLTVTPHIAWAPIETRERLMGVVMKNIECWIKGEPINVVNK